MHPAFRSPRAAAGFGVVLAVFLGLPVLLKWVGPPTREQAFSMVPTAGGPVAMVKHLIYDDSGRADVLFVGSSLIKTDVHGAELARLLAARLGRPMRIDILELNWYGADQQYFMLKDYLAHHSPPPLIVLHVPQARASENGPHPQAYRWLRYGDLDALPAGFPLVSKLQLYGEMVLGAPRQALALLRPNRLGIEAPVPADELASAVGLPAAVRPPDAAGTAPAESVPAAALLPLTAPQFEVLTPSLRGVYRFAMGPYTRLFLAQIAALVKGSGAKLVLIHLPLGQDPLTDRVQELQSWTTLFGPDIRMIAIPKARLYDGVEPGKFYFPGDNHMNTVGGQRFTESIAAPVAQAYLEASRP
jgi:hypothetical protein